MPPIHVWIYLNTLTSKRGKAYTCPESWLQQRCWTKAKGNQATPRQAFNFMFVWISQLLYKGVASVTVPLAKSLPSPPPPTPPKEKKISLSSFSLSFVSQSSFYIWWVEQKEQWCLRWKKHWRRGTDRRGTKSSGKSKCSATKEKLASSRGVAPIFKRMVFHLPFSFLLAFPVYYLQVNCKYSNICTNLL